MNRWIFSCGVFLAMLLAANDATAAGADKRAVYAQFLVQLKQRAGAGAKECGVLESSGETALVCADQAILAGQPFWFAAQMEGDDSELWTGIARNAKGYLYRLDFDADVHGGGTTHPLLSLNGWKCGKHDVRTALSAYPFGCDDARPKRKSR